MTVGPSQILAEAPIGIAVFEGADHALTVANERWRAVYGLEPVLGPALARKLDQVMRTGEPTELLDPTTHVAIALQAIRAGERVVGVTAVCVDAESGIAALLTAATRAEAARANHLKDRLLGVISHELRAPVTALLLWERLLRESTSDEMRLRALDAIHQSATAQVQLVTDLLDFARALDNKLHATLEPVMLLPLVERSITTARTRATAKQLAIETALTPDLGIVHADPPRLQQILDTLLSNAIEGSRIGGSIAVRAGRAHDRITIEIVDHGRGIAPELLPHIFEAFGPGEPRGRLGLAIAEQLAKLHGGTLTAHSEGLDQGSHFTLVLPAT